MLMIRLQRIGKKKKPTYRFVINEKARDTQAKSLEILGHYSPTENPKILKLKVDRIKYWLSKGAQTSETVNNLLIKEGVIEGKKMKSVTITNKRKAKMNDKKVEKEEKEKELAGDIKAKVEAPAEESKIEEKDGEEKKPSEDTKEYVSKEEKKEEVKVEEKITEEPKEEITKEKSNEEEKITE